MSRETAASMLASARKAGLFDPKKEHDACGVGFIADLKGRKSHKIVADALAILENLEHRGAVGADPLAGDGAGHSHPDSTRLLQDRVRKAENQAARRRTLCGRPPFSCRKTSASAHIASAYGHASSAKKGLSSSVGARYRSTTVRCPRWSKALSRSIGRSSSGARSPFAMPKPSNVNFTSSVKVVSNALFDSYKRPRHRTLHRVVVLAHIGLQGHVPVVSGQGLLQRPLGRPVAVVDGASPSTFSRPTRSRRGSWRIPIAWLPTTAKSTPCAGNVNWMAARQASVSSPHFGSDISRLWPISYEGQSR